MTEHMKRKEKKRRRRRRREEEEEEEEEISQAFFSVPDLMHGNQLVFGKPVRRDETRRDKKSSTSCSTSINTV